MKTRLQETRKRKYLVGLLFFTIFFVMQTMHLHAQLNGTYTIGGAGADYADFTSAVTDLDAVGVNGDVTFNVADGTYNEQITVLTYTGNSNTVTFQSASGDSTAVILTFSANSTDNFTLKFDAAQNVTFKKMTIQATNSSYSRAIEIGAGCTSIQLQNNQIIGIETTQTSDNHAVIYNNGRVDTVNISDNFIQHGSYAMYLRSSSGDESTFVYLSGNDIQGQTNIAMFLMRLDAPFIGKNRLECDANAINLYYHTQTAEISGNTVITGDSKGGISVYEGTSEISNNMIITEGEGIIISDVTDASIFYNSVKTFGNSAAIYINAGQTVDLKNNIAYNSTGPAIHLDDMIPVTYSSDYNCLRSDGNVFGIVDNMGGETRYSSLAEYRTGTSTEANSISVTPRFHGQFDLHTSHLALNSQGTVISETSDFDGDSRDGSTPDIGADEFTPADEDVGVYAIYTGASTTCSEVRVSVENSGLLTLNNIPVTAIITTPTTTETLNATIPGPLWSGASTTISMGDISSTETGNFSIKAFTGYPGDNNHVNDTFTVDIVKTSPFTITHVEDFNTTDDKEKWKLNTGYHINPPGGVNYLKYVDGITTGSMAIMNNSIGSVTEESYLIFDFKNDLPTSANSNINIYILGYECNERVDTLYTINGSIFQVSDYETYQAPIGDNAGKYLRLAVEVSKGSSEQLSFHIDNITIANAPLIDLGEDKNSCTGETVPLDAGAGTGYTYSWHELSDPGTELGTNQTLDVTTDGDYVAIVTEPDYSLSNSDTVNVVFDDTPTANDQTPEICDNEATGVDLTELDNAITGGNGLDVTWYTDAGLTSPVADPSSTNVNDGDVFYARVGTGSCTATATVTYTVKTSPTVSDITGSDPTTCSGTDGSITMEGLIASTSYQVSYDDGAVTVGPATMTSNGSGEIIITGLDAGTYTNFEIEKDNCSTTDNSVINLNDPAGITVDVEDDKSITNGSSTTIDGTVTGGSGSYDYSWEPAASLADASVEDPTTTNLTTSTHFILTATDQITHCDGTDDIWITVTGGLFNIAGTEATEDTICTGDDTELEVFPEGGSGTYTYSWKILGGSEIATTKTTPVSPTSTTSYEVTVDDGANSDKDTIEIVVHDLPAVTFDPVSDLCIDADTLTLTQGSPAGGGYAGTGILIETIDGKDNRFVPSDAGMGTHTIIYTYQNNNGCENSATQTITVRGLPNVTFGIINDICENAQPINLDQGSPVGGTYSGTGITTSPEFDPSVAGTGTHSVEYYFTDAYGCSALASQSVTVLESPSVNNLNPSLCEDNPGSASAAGIDLNAYESLISTDAGASFSWYTDAGMTTPVTNPTSTTINDGDVLHVKVDNGNCTASATATFSVGNTIDVNDYFPAICEDHPGSNSATANLDDIEQDVVGDIVTYSITWYEDQAKNNEVTNTTSVEVTSDTLYALVEAGNCSSMAKVAYSIKPTPVVDIGQDTSIAENEAIELEAGNGYDTYQWNTSETTSTITVDGTETGTGEHPYHVTVSLDGCEAADTIVITVEMDNAVLEGKTTAFSIYPNPARNHFMVEISNANQASFTLQIIDQTGRIMKEEKIFQGASLINCSILERGIYIITISDNKQIYQDKLLIE